MDQEWKLFADLAELAGGREVSVAVEPDATVRDALSALLADRPELAERVLDGEDVADDVNLLHDGEPVRGDGLDADLSDDDDLALFPPVSGG